MLTEKTTSIKLLSVASSSTSAGACFIKKNICNIDWSYIVDTPEVAYKRDTVAGKDLLPWQYVLFFSHIWHFNKHFMYQ